MNKFYKNKENIINWLEKYEVKNYTLISDEKYGFIVDVNGVVNLANKKLAAIPIKFNKIKGSFSCSDNQLTLLEFCPKSVGGGFYCKSNKLTSLEFCPQFVDSFFECGNNQLTSLEFCPNYVGRGFYCGNNELTSLEFCPKFVGGFFDCSDNPKLQKYQEIKDFKEIYSIHKNLLVEKFAGKLCDSLNSVETEKKQNKIKL